jgi:hypothetical protein
MSDDTEAIRRQMLIAINSTPKSRAELETRFGKVWNPDELSDDFEVLEFAAPLVVVRLNSNGALGMLMFQHHPRFYFNFVLDDRRGV